MKSSAQSIPVVPILTAEIDPKIYRSLGPKLLLELVLITLEKLETELNSASTPTSWLSFFCGDRQRRRRRMSVFCLPPARLTAPD